MKEKKIGSEKEKTLLATELKKQKWLSPLNAQNNCLETVAIMMMIIMEHERGKREREMVEKWQMKGHGQPCFVLFGLPYFSIWFGLHGMDEEEEEGEEGAVTFLGCA